MVSDSATKSSSAGKKSLLSRFKRAAKKVILVQRFSWNSDILHGHSLPQKSIADVVPATTNIQGGIQIVRVNYYYDDDDHDRQYKR